MKFKKLYTSIIYQIANSVNIVNIKVVCMLIFPTNEMTVLILNAKHKDGGQCWGQGWALDETNVPC